MHPTPLCMQTQLISHFTNSSDISTYQIPYRRQIRTCPNDLIAFPSWLCTGERIADPTQLRFHSLSPSIWFYEPSGSTPCCYTQFWTISDRLFNYFKHAFISTTSQPLGQWIRDVPTFQIWCLYVHTPSGMSITVFRRLSTSIPLWWFSIFSISALFIVFCIYCTHLFSKIQVHTSPHSTESLRDTI